MSCRYEPVARHPKLQLQADAFKTALYVAGMAIVFSGGAAGAQHSESITLPKRTMGVWTAIARDQPLETREGKTHDRDLYFVGVRVRWELIRSRRAELAYTANLLPAVLSTGMPSYADVPSSCPPTGPCVVPLSIQQKMTRQKVYGAGVTPTGLELRLNVTRFLALLGRGDAGLVYFSRPVPDPEGRRLNFLGEAAVLAELRIAQRVWLTGGYRLNHISNGGSAPVNTGMDSRMLELGLTFVR